MKQVVLFLFYWWDNQGAERLSNVPVVPQLINDKCGARSLTFCSRTQHYSYFLGGCFNFPTDGHFGFFQGFATISSDAWTSLHWFLQHMWMFLNREMKQPAHGVYAIINFKRTVKLPSKVSIPNYTPSCTLNFLKGLLLLWSTSWELEGDKVKVERKSLLKVIQIGYYSKRH